MARSSEVRRTARHRGRQPLVRVLGLALLTTIVVATSSPATSSAAGSTTAASTPIRFAAAMPMPASAIADGQLVSVSCPTATACMAVGDNARGQAGWTASTEADGVWSWSPFRVLAHAAALPDFLTSIDCPIPSTCVAVGYTQDGYRPASWSEGTAILASATFTSGAWTWSAPTNLAPGTTGVDRLNAVRCPTRTTCVAVGQDTDQQGIATAGLLSASGWSWAPATVVGADSTGRGELRGLSCPSTTTCVAVGDDDRTHLGAPTGAAVTTTGTLRHGTWSWSKEVPVLPGSSGTTELTSVGCALSTSCAAVGEDAALRAVVSIGSVVSGVWSWTAAAPLGSGPALDTAAVACAPASCTAVGDDSNGAAFVTTAGARAASWGSVRPLPGAGSRTAVLDALACPLEDDCVAVGLSAGTHDVSAATVAPPGNARGVTASSEDGALFVRWAAPLFDGGARITRYAAVARPGGDRCIARVTVTSPDSCTIVGLKNGVRYLVRVTAENGFGLGPPSVPSVPVTPRRFQPPIPSPFTRSVLAYVAHQPCVLTASVYDVLTGQTWTINPSSEQHTASIVKVDILATLLYDAQVAHTTLSASTVELATEMIEESDNDAAQALYVMIGQVAGLTDFNRLVGLTGTMPNIAWGFTNTTSLDQTRLVRLFAVPNRLLDRASRRFGLNLMRHVDPEQAWGISSGPVPGTSVAIKNGWYPTEPDDWQVNSIGWVAGSGRSYVIAVLTNQDEEMGTGVSAIEGLSQLLWRNLAPPRGA